MRRRLVTPAALVSGALLASWSVVFQRGWPHNHEFLAAHERVEWFRRAFAAGDLVPLWTRFCFNGHGSPGPLLYHRLFNTLGGALALLLDSTEWAVRALVPLLLIVGATGVVRGAATLEWPRPLGLWAAGMFMFAHYTLTDWMVRGAMAEFTAMMVLPWFIGACLRLARGERAGVWLGLAGAALFYSHTAMFLFSLPMAGLVVRRRVVKDLAIAAAIVMVLAGPYALAIAQVGGHFNLSALRAYSPHRQFVSLGRYFADGFPWGDTWEGFSVELGRGLVVVLLAGLVALWPARARVPRSSAIFLGASAALYFALQLPIAAPLYRHVLGLRYLGFPWRLLAPLTVLVILAVGESAVALWKARPTWLHAVAGVLVAALVFQVQFNVRAQDVRHGRFGSEEIRASLAKLDGPASAGEFLLRGVSLKSLPPVAPLVQVDHGTLHQATLGEEAHLRRLDFIASCSEPCLVRTSQFDSPLLSFTSADGARASRDVDGTMMLALPAGEHRVTLRARGFLDVLAF